MGYEKLGSIIIPLYNYSQYLCECLSSCVTQKEVQDGKVEVIVIDDGSTDEPERILETFEKEYRIRWKRTENRGYSAAKNEGIKMSKGEYLIFLDSDDVFTPNSLKKRFDAIGDYDMVHALAWRYRDGSLDGYNKNAKIHAQTVMMRRDVFDKFGLFYEPLRSKSDKEMWYRLGIHPRSPFRPRIKCKRIKEFVALYRKHDKQMHKCRKADPKVNDKIEKIFDERIAQLKSEGITINNTRFI